MQYTVVLSAMMWVFVWRSSLKSLFAFERVHVPAGETVTVQLYPELTDFGERASERAFLEIHIVYLCNVITLVAHRVALVVALVDGSGTKTLAAGDWTLEFGVAQGGGYARRTLRAVL